MSDLLNNTYALLDKEQTMKFRLRPEFHNAVQYGFLTEFGYVNDIKLPSMKLIFRDAIQHLIAAYEAKNINGHEMYVIDYDSVTFLKKPTESMTLKELLLFKYTQYEIDFTHINSLGFTTEQHVGHIAEELRADAQNFGISFTEPRRIKGPSDLKDLIVGVIITPFLTRRIENFTPNDETKNRMFDGKTILPTKDKTGFTESQFIWHTLNRLTEVLTESMDIH